MSETLKRPIANPGTQTGGGLQTDEIFLSPRVVDRQAFNDFASQLRALIEQAKAQTDALRAAAGDAQRTRDSLRDAANANQMKLDMATRALSTMDQKIDQLRRMIEGAADAATRIDGLKEEADRVIAERVGILCQRLGEAEDAAVARVDEIHAQLRTTLQAVSEGESRLRESCGAARAVMTGEFPALVQRAEALQNGENGLVAMVERAENAGRLAIRATADLGEIRQQAEQARKILADALNAAVPIIDEAGTIQGHLEATVSEAVRISQNARQSMEEFVSGQRRSVEEELSRFAPALDKARAEIESLTQLTEAAGQAASAATADAEQATRGLTNVLEQLQPWRRILIGESADAPVGAAINTIVVELKNEIRGVAGALRAIAERAELALEPTNDPALPTAH